MNIEKKKQSQASLFNIEKKIEQSTSTVSEIRVPIFLPVAKIAHNSKIALEFKKNENILKLKTSWGNVELRGRKLLTSVHRDILDCISTYNRKTELCMNGDIKIYFTLTNILKQYGHKNPNANIAWLKKRIEEIRDLTVNYVRNNGDNFDFNLISNISHSEELKMYCITLDKAYVKFYESELSINYKKELPKLLQIKDPIIKTIIRWFFTHSSQTSYGLTTVLDAIGIPTDFLSLRMFQLHKKSIKDGIGILNKFGIDFNFKEEIFFYTGNENVAFIPSLFSNVKKPNKKLKENKLSEYNGSRIKIENDSYTIANIELILDEDDEADYYLIYIAGSDETLKFNKQKAKNDKDFEIELVSWIRQNNL